MTHRLDILVVLEPAADAGTPSAEGLDGRLLAEAERLAAMIPAAQLAPDAGAAVIGAVTWPARGSFADVPALADALAAHAHERGARIVICLDTDLGHELAPLVAAALDTCALLRVTDAAPGVESATGDASFTWVRPVFGGHLEQESTYAPGAVQVVAVAPEALQSTTGAPGRLDVATVTEGRSAQGESIGRIRRLGIVPPDYRTVDLVHARRIVAAGAGAVGVPGDEALALVVELAELLEGSVGATRPVTDDARLPKERLVGQTGKTVAPDLYLALGISGSPHHMAGVQGAERVLAVNRDPAAPIMAFSDAGFVGDLRDVLPELIGLIKGWRDGGVTGDGSPGAGADAAGVTGGTAGPADGGAGA